MESVITTRYATDEDLNVLYDFERGIIEAERPMDDTLRAGEIHYYDLVAMIEDQNVALIVAECNDELIGSAYIAIRDSKPYWTHKRHGYMGFMFVIPDYRGQGVNKLIMDRCIFWAKSRGLTEIQLEVYTVNKAAIRAYEKAGMTNHLVRMRKSI